MKFVILLPGRELGIITRSLHSSRPAYIEDHIMSLLDLFKKSPQARPSKEEIVGSPALQKRRYDAAIELLGFIEGSLNSSDGKAHAVTVLSVVAWLAGTSLYRSLNSRYLPSAATLMLSNEMNEDWKKLVNLFVHYCQRIGIHLRPDELALKTPDEHKPQVEVLQAQEKFQARYDEIMRKHGLDDLDGARAGMLVCAISLRYHCRVARDLDPGIAAGIITRGILTGAIVSGMRTYPPSLNLEGPIGLEICASTKCFESRLVLGEHDAAIQDVLDHGGMSINIGAEVLRMLQRKNIDPYIAYEREMCLQVRAKIPRIDFVRANVEELFTEWEWKPRHSAPVHVRLMLWLKENGSRYGYEQNGNSWVLKS